MLPRTLIFMLACAGIGYFLGRTRGMGLQGFFFGLAFGPLGWALIMLWPTSWIQGPVPRTHVGPSPAGGKAGPAFREDGGGHREAASADKPRGSGAGCPRCGKPVQRDAAACPHCGNVLVPIHYEVEDGDSRGA